MIETKEIKFLEDIVENVCDLGEHKYFLPRHKNQ